MLRRGIEIVLRLNPTSLPVGRVAEMLGNLAAFTLQDQRHETLQWRVMLVEEVGGGYHYRLAVRHPNRLLDRGFSENLGTILRRLSGESETQLESEFNAAVSAGMRVARLEQVSDEIDYWQQEDLWDLLWIGEGVSDTSR